MELPEIHELAMAMGLMRGFEDPQGAINQQQESKMIRNFKTKDEQIAYELGVVDATKAEIRMDVPPPAESLRDIKIAGLGAVLTQDPWKHRAEGMRFPTNGISAAAGATRRPTPGIRWCS